MSRTEDVEDVSVGGGAHEERHGGEGRTEAGSRLPRL